MSAPAFYHNLGKAIFLAFEGRRNFILRGNMEIKNMQSDTTSSDKFALSTFAKITEGFKADFLKIVSDVSLFVKNATGTYTKVHTSESAKYTLYFNPIDNLQNCSRGLEWGSTFLINTLDSQSQEEPFLAMVFSSKNQTFLYSEKMGFTYSSNKRIKSFARTQSQSLLFALNEVSDLPVRKIITGSLSNDLLFLLDGSIDGIFAKNLQKQEESILKIFATSMGMLTDNIKDGIALFHPRHQNIIKK